MSLESEMMADTPVVLLRLDTVGAGVDGDVVPDSSGNELNGELGYSGTDTPWGYPSAVETDPLSREFLGMNAGRVGATLDVTSEILVPSDDLMEVVGDLACEAVVRPLTDVPLASTFPLVQKQGSGGIGLTVDSGTRLCGFVFDTAATMWVVPSTFEVTSDLGRAYHVVVERVVDELVLRIDGELNNSITITSGLPTLFNSNPFGVHPGAGFYDVRYAFAAWYTHSLGGTRARVHYEAMINATLLRGYSNVVPTAILNSEFEPDPVNFPFRHNWGNPLSERISFLTGLSTTKSGGEEANGARSKPRREIELTQIVRDNLEREQLRAKLWANQDRKWFIPILEDRQQLDASLSSGITVIPTLTEFKDFQADGWLHLRELNTADQIVKSEYLQVDTFSESEVTLASPTENSYAAFLSEVCPARRGYLPASIGARGHSADVEEVPLTARLVAEDEPSIPNRIVEWEPTILYKGYEAYDLAEWQSNDWTEVRDYEIDRAAEEVGFDAGIFDVESDTNSATESFSWSVLLKGKDRIAAFLGWFYYHAGSLVYLWVPTNQRNFTIISDAGSNLTVSGHIYTENYAGSEARRDLAFIYNNNTMALRRISSSAPSGSNDVLTLNTTVPTQTNLRSVSFLKFCRIDADTLEKALYTDDVMRATWRFRELLHSPD